MFVKFREPISSVINHKILQETHTRVLFNVTELYITVDNHINIVKLRVLRINKIFWLSFLSSAGVWQFFGHSAGFGRDRVGY